jgi:hypothetical protein
MSNKGKGVHAAMDSASIAEACKKEKVTGGTKQTSRCVRALFREAEITHESSPEYKEETIREKPTTKIFMESSTADQE